MFPHRERHLYFSNYTKGDNVNNARRWAHLDIKIVDPKTIPEDWVGRLKYYADRRAAQKVQAALKASRAKVWRR